jgi:hypothetical protein
LECKKYFVRVITNNMIVLFVLELIGSFVGLYNIAKGVQSICVEADSYNRQQTEYNNYVHLQKVTPDKLTESQYRCFEEDFEII